MFLDRDGVINEDTGHLYKICDWIFTTNCLKALKAIVEKGYQLIIITNQAGIAKGYFTVEDYERLTDWYIDVLKAHEIPILDVFYCPHHPQGKVVQFTQQCKCRKPQPGMIKRGLDKYEIDMDNSVLVGDKASDVQAGFGAGLKKLVLLDSKYSFDEDMISIDVSRYSSLYDFSLSL